MKICPYCNREISDNSRFCIYCMKPLAPKRAITPIHISRIKGWHIFIAALLVFVLSTGVVLAASNNDAPIAGTAVSNVFENPNSSYALSDQIATTNSTQGNTPTFSRPSKNNPTSSLHSYNDTTSTSQDDDKVYSSLISTSSKNEPPASSNQSHTSSASTTTSSKAPTATNGTSNKYTEGYYTYTISNGKATIVDVDTKISGTVTIPNKLGGCNVVTVGNRAFYDCRKMTSVAIPSSVLEIAEEAFYSCDILEKVTFSEGLTTIADRAFSQCNKITSIVIPNSVTTIGMDAFSCSSLSNIKLGDNIVNMGDSSFSSTAYYDTYENWEANDILYIGKYLVASYMTTTTRATIKEGTIAVWGQAFYGCELSSISFPSSLKTIGEGAFYGCGGLKTLTIPGYIKHIGYGAFAQFESLENVTIENGVTTISAGMFEGCKNLETIKIPKSVKNIEFYAFSGCEYLTDIYYEGSKADRDKIIIDSEENAYLLNATWHYNS